MPRLAILDDYQKIALRCADWSQLPESIEIDVFHDNVKDREALVQRLAPYQILVIMRERTPFPRALLERLPNLKLIVGTSGRNRGIDLEACEALGVLVCHTELGAAPTAELAWGLILALAKKIPFEDRATREGHWGVDMAVGLSGRTLGLLGLGKLGERVARVGLAFDMRVIAWSENLTRQRAREVGVERVERGALFETSDFLSVHLVLGSRTRGLVGRRELASMKPTAYLINTSRGPIVDESALIEAVTSGQIAGAGLDVFGEEPLPLGDPLRTMPNSVITPHIGGFVQENYELWYRGAVEDVLAWLAGAPIRVLGGRQT